MLNKKSEELISYFTKNKCLYKQHFNNLTKYLFLSFYKERYDYVYPVNIEQLKGQGNDLKSSNY